MPPFGREEIVSRCSQALPDDCLYYQPYGNKVLRLSDELVVKFGFCLSQDEARNQTKAYELIDQRIVRVPRVYDWFEHEDLGYIVMEFVDGAKARSLDEPLIAQSLSDIVLYFQSLKSNTVGPLARGPYHPIIFGEDDPPNFQMISDMEAWFNERLMDPSAKVSLGQFGLVLCHLDLTCRNILWQPGKPPCVLDWGWAGFYPRLFEKCCQILVGREEDGETISKMQLSTAEEVQVELVLRAWHNQQRFCL